MDFKKLYSFAIEAYFLGHLKSLLIQKPSSEQLKLFFTNFHDLNRTLQKTFLPEEVHGIWLQGLKNINFGQGKDISYALAALFARLRAGYMIGKSVQPDPSTMPLRLRIVDGLNQAQKELGEEQFRRLVHRLITELLPNANKFFQESLREICSQYALQQLVTQCIVQKFNKEQKKEDSQDSDSFKRTFSQKTAYTQRIFNKAFKIVKRQRSDVRFPYMVYTPRARVSAEQSQLSSAPNENDL